MTSPASYMTNSDLHLHYSGYLATSFCFLIILIMFIFCGIFFYLKHIRENNEDNNEINQSGDNTRNPRTNNQTSSDENVTIDINDDSHLSPGNNTPRYKKARGPRTMNIPIHQSEFTRMQTPKANVKAPNFCEIIPIPTPPLKYWICGLRIRIFLLRI